MYSNFFFFFFFFFFFKSNCCHFEFTYNSTAKILLILIIQFQYHKPKNQYYIFDPFLYKSHTTMALPMLSRTLQTWKVIIIIILSLHNVSERHQTAQNNQQTMLSNDVKNYCTYHRHTEILWGGKSMNKLYYQKKLLKIIG
eukprot:TRINITY_DN11976_c0_g1_i1.p1 TRINITY_DN11976_c0_g1~~TRINITY_DN11976_c0_g1_i1.p1  ORF type:complete len:141 (-),score=1.12 TRINITY_DN11976_c0_g1_i1:26-448(-)